MCGGASRLQVFGPPPSSPAVGYNVLAKCEPWCVTADENTNDVSTCELRHGKTCLWPYEDI